MENVPQLDEALESIAAIREAAAAARKAEELAIAAKEVYQVRKKARDAAIAELQRVIEDHTKPLPLFDRPAETRAKSPESALPGASAGSDVESIDPNPKIDPGANTDAWRDVALSTIEGIAGKLADKLAEAGIPTLGALADHSARGGRLFDLPGIGEKTAEKIEAALDAYWEARKLAEWKAEEAARASAGNPADAVAEATGPEPAPQPGDWRWIKLASILPAEIARKLEAVDLVEVNDVVQWLSEGATLEDLPSRVATGDPMEWTGAEILTIRRALLALRWDNPEVAEAIPFGWLARPAAPNESGDEVALGELMAVEREIAEERRQAKLAEEAAGVAAAEAATDAAIADHDEAVAAGEPEAPAEVEPAKPKRARNRKKAAEVAPEAGPVADAVA